MEYPALFEPAPEGGFAVTFPDFDWGITQGDTEEEAIANAREALALWFEPAPVKLNKGAKLMELAVP